MHQQPARLLLRRSSQVRAQIVSERGEQRAGQRLRRSRLPQQQLRQLPVPARRQGAVQSDSVRTRGRGAKHKHDLLPLLFIHAFTIVSLEMIANTGTTCRRSCPASWYACRSAPRHPQRRHQRSPEIIGNEQ